MPRVLEAYDRAAHNRLAEVADVLDLAPLAINENKARAVIYWIDEMNRKLGIPKGFGSTIKKKNIKNLAAHAAKEANPLYPVPMEFDASQLEKILEEVAA